MAGKIVSVGSYNTDLVARTAHLPVPGETIMASSLTKGPGGKGANQLVVVGRIGGEALFITKVGRDAYGEEALDYFRAEGIDTAYIFRDEVEPTGMALICVDEERGENFIVVNQGAYGKLTTAEIDTVREVIADAGVIVLQLEIPQEINEYVKEIAVAKHVPIVFNPAPAKELSDEFLAGIEIITPNETEAEILTGVFPHDLASCRAAAAVLFERGVKKVIITLGADGYYANDGLADALVPAYRVTVVDTTGAGDCFTGSLATKIAAGEDFFAAARFASAAAALATTKAGAGVSMPYLKEVEELLAAQPEV